MLTDVKNWDISEEESASDHNIIKFSINLDKKNYTRKTPYRTTIQNKGTSTNQIQRETKIQRY